MGGKGVGWRGRRCLPGFLHVWLASCLDHAAGLVFGFVFFDLPLFLEGVLRLFFGFSAVFVLFAFVAHVHSSVCWMRYPMLKVRYGVCMTAPGSGFAGADPSNADKDTPDQTLRNLFRRVPAMRSDSSNYCTS
jgi:hypothetical protein